MSIRARRSPAHVPQIFSMNQEKHASIVMINGCAHELRVWTEDEWAREPKRSQPYDARPFDDGFGWYTITPCLGYN